MFAAFPANAVQATVICPHGEVEKLFGSLGMTVIPRPGISRWNETDHGYYHGLRWAVLLREIAYLPFTMSALLKAKRCGPFDVIHVNDIDVAYVGGIAKTLMRAPLLVHVRCLLRDRMSSWRVRHMRAFLRHQADQVVAIDQTVQNSIWPGVSSVVVHNGLRVTAGKDCDRPDSPSHPLRVAYVGGLTLPKGIMEFAQAAKLCRERNLNAEFWVVGENARTAKGLWRRLLSRVNLSHDVATGLNSFIKEHNLEDILVPKGFVVDVAGIYRDIDVLCFPSRVNAPGRPVFEAAYFGVPGIVAVREPTRDTIIPGETGICIPAPDPVLIADAVEFFYRNPAERCRMGENARALAHANFDIQRNAARLLAIYHRLTGNEAHAALSSASSLNA